MLHIETHLHLERNHWLLVACGGSRVSHLHPALLRQGPLDVVVAFGSQLDLILAARLQGEDEAEETWMW